MRFLILFGLFGLVVPHISFAQQTEQDGLLIMAHGGSEEWNRAVIEAVSPISNLRPTSIAFGMAHPDSLQKSVDELAYQSVSRIVVVRLFMSGRSFLKSTEHAFGLTDHASQQRTNHSSSEELNVNVPVLLSPRGLMDSAELGAVLADRASELTKKAENESVLILGHGPGDDLENEEWLRRMDILANHVRGAAPFYKVRVATLREDWTGKRAAMEAELRDFVQSETVAGRSVIIIPFRLFGFGPYSEVFEGLNYRSDGLGFLPDGRITNWIEDEFRRVVSVDS